MFLRKVFLGLISSLHFIALASFSTSFIGEAIAEESVSNSDLSTAAENKVKAMYPEFIKLVEKGASESEMMTFFTKNFDTDAISKNFCGIVDKKLIESIGRFLIWRLKTEAIQVVKDYELKDNSFRCADKSKTVSLKCVLDKKSETVEMTVVFSKDKGTLGAIREVIVLNIPLMDGAKTVMKKYFENNGLKINSLKAEERAAKCCEALEDFIKTNDRKS